MYFYIDLTCRHLHYKCELTESTQRQINPFGFVQEMDWETIVAGLLHDTVEDTEHVTFERIEDQFGPAVRRIVEGETKASNLFLIKYRFVNGALLSP